MWTGKPEYRRSSHKEIVEALLVQATEVRSLARLYIGLLERLPESLAGISDDFDGLTYWTGVLRTFRAKNASIPYQGALASIVDEWFREPELRQRYANPSFEEYIPSLCNSFLGRQPSVDEAAHWRTISSCPEKGPAKLVVILSESNECKNYLNPLINERLHDAATKRMTFR